MVEHRLIYRKHTNPLLALFSIQPTNLCIECSCGWFGGPVMCEGIIAERAFAQHLLDVNKKAQEASRTAKRVSAQLPARKSKRRDQ